MTTIVGAGCRGALLWVLLGALSPVGAEAVSGGQPERIRPSALAGTWYPADGATLADTVDTLLTQARADDPPAGRIRALVVPHAGLAYSGATAAAGFALLAGSHDRRVVLLAPAHRGAFDGLSVADVDAYATPLGRVPLDAEAIATLRSSPIVQSSPQAHEREHAIEIELPFLQRALTGGWRLVPILVGRLDAEDYANAADLIRPLLDDETLLVVSSDFTHYGARFGYVPFPPDSQLPERIRVLDDGAIDRAIGRDFEGLLQYQTQTGITICGYRPLALLLRLLPADAQVHPLAYATSGALTGDWDHSVSYAALAVTAPEPLGSTGATESGSKHLDQGLDDTALRRLHKLAVLGLRRAVLGRDEVPDSAVMAAVADLPEPLTEPAGAFVTLWKQDELRGCVGHVPDNLPLYESVLQSGFNAARDARFPPLRSDDLTALDVEVSVLTPPHSIDSLEELRIGHHGITLQRDGRFALYLPKVATNMGWDLETTLSQLALKAGLPADAWRDGAELEVFTSREYRAPYAAPLGAGGAVLP